MFEFRGAREAEREFAERGSANQTRGQQAYEAAMAQNEQAQNFRAQEAAMAAGVPMGPTVSPAMDLGFGASLGAVAYPTAYQTFTPGQQASLNQYLAAGPGQDVSFGLAPMLIRAAGAPTKYQQLASGNYRPVFVGDQLYGSFGEGLFGGQVYTGRTLPDEVAAEYGIPGYNMPSTDDDVVPTVTDPVTMEQKCPDGYIFDEDLQACRLATTAPVAQPLEARPAAPTYSLLGQAPDGLLDFQRRYGLPQQQMDFSLLT